MLICVVLAGGRGTRLIPLTDTTPKPLLQAGGKSLLEWNMAGTAPFVDKFVIVISYLGQQIIDQIGDTFMGKPVEYVWQANPKGGTLDAFRTAIFGDSDQESENQKADYLVIHADDIHGDLTWQNMQTKIASDPQKAYLSGKVLTDPSLAKSFGMFEVKQKLSEAAIENLEESIKSQNKEIVVDCLIQNERGQILVQKRSSDRKLYPNCWDLPGGHVEPGDTILETISKEIQEETGLEEFEVAGLLGQVDWKAPTVSGQDESQDKVILQFLVKARNLENLRLEEGKAVEFAWIGKEDNLEFLKANKTDDFYVFDIVQKALTNLELKTEFSQFEFSRIVEKPDYYVSNLANIAISYFPNKVLQFIPKTIENTGKEAYITDLFNDYSQNFPIEVVPTEGSWLPVTSIEDLEKAREILKNAEI